MPIKVTQLVDDKYLMDYSVIGKLIDNTLILAKEYKYDLETDGKTYMLSFTYDAHIYNMNIHVFKKYLDLKIVYDCEVSDMKKKSMDSEKVVRRK